MQSLFLALVELFAGITTQAAEPAVARAPAWARVMVALLAVVAGLVLPAIVVVLVIAGAGVAKGLASTQ